MCSRSFMVQKRGPKSIARYELGEVLGKGSFGSVVKALDRVSGTARAWKTCCKSKEGELMFRKEAVTMSILDHPHICRLFDVIEDARNLYFVLELCEGGDLQHRLADLADLHNSLPEPTVAPLLRQLFGAMHYLHERCIAHSDFASRNVLLDNRPLEQCTAKLADFGSCRSFSPALALGPHKGDMWGLGLLMRGMLCDINRVLGNSTTAASESAPPRMPLDPSAWLGKSPEARCLCGRLLRRDPVARWSAQEAMHHPWFFAMELPPVEVPDDLLQRFRSFGACNSLVRVSLQALAEQRPGREDLFSALDRNCDGLLAPGDLCACLQEVDESVSKELLQEIFVQVDSDGVGAIELSVFNALMLQEERATSKKATQAAFRVVDRDMNGKISLEDLRRIFPDVDEQEAIDMIAAADLDGDGSIDLAEFRAMIQQYFKQPPSRRWQPVRGKQNDALLKAKTNAMVPRIFRTVDDDTDTHSSCAQSSVIDDIFSDSDSDSEGDSDTLRSFVEQAKPARDPGGHARLVRKIADISTGCMEAVDSRCMEAVDSPKPPCSKEAPRVPRRQHKEAFMQGRSIISL
mmetsp:Transcript_136432/g.323114  ORF Transcript_136432/g.323114 Transcript_136432/m.323114 type:complete len:576 (+) Transcript_136432:61-1788(+)